MRRGGRHEAHLADLGKGGAELVGVVVALVATGSEGPQQDCREVRVEVGEAGQVARVEGLSAARRGAAPLPGIIAGEGLVGGDTEREQVEVGQLLAGWPGDTGRFGGEVAGRAEGGGKGGVGGDRRVEVEDAGAVGGPQQIAGLDVAVEHPARVQVGEAGQTIVEELAHIGGAERAALVEDAFEVLPLGELHAQVRESALGQPLRVDQPHDIGMGGDPAQDAVLALQALTYGLPVPGDDLQDLVGVVEGVEHPVDDPELPLSQQGAHPEPLGEAEPFGQAGVAVRVVPVERVPGLLASPASAPDSGTALVGAAEPCDGLAGGRPVTGVGGQQFPDDRLELGVDPVRFVKAVERGAPRAEGGLLARIQLVEEHPGRVQIGLR